MAPAFNRRTALALPALLGATSAARAAAPFLGGQTPPWHRLRLGAFELTVVSDGVMPLAPTHPIYGGGVATAEQVHAALTAARLPSDSIPAETNCLVVNTGRELVLIDTGNGPTRAFGPRTGRLLDNLRAAGIAPAEIDVVALTHVHPDHTWGIAGGTAFPNARYAIPAVDWDFFTAEARAAAPAPLGPWVAMTRTVLLPVAAKTTMLRPGQDIVSGLRTVDAPGHSPGHLAIHVESEGRRLLLLGDAATHPVLALRHPDWPLVFDADPAQATATRRSLLGMAAADRVEVLGYHFAWPGLGQVEADGNGFRYLPTPWRWSDG